MTEYTAAVALANRKAFQRWLGVPDDGVIGPISIAAFRARMSNKNAPAANAADITIFAQAVGISVEQMNAIAKVETGGRSGFGNDGVPTYLYERHYFWRLTDGFYPITLWNNPKGGGYNDGSEADLYSALRVDPVAALSSCSWGKFQIMGSHWDDLGYASIFQFVESMTVSQSDHYEAFVRFIKVNGLSDEAAAISDKPNDNIPFVNRYNGSKGVVLNKYHIKLAEEMK